MSKHIGIAAALVVVMGAAISVFSWISGLSARVDVISAEVDSYESVQVDYARLAATVFEEYGDQLKGPRGSPVSVEEVAASLFAEHADLLRGPEGKAGADALPVSVDEVVAALVSQNAESLGEPGGGTTDVSLEELARVLVQNYADQLTGPQGEPGPKGEPADAYPLAKLAELIAEEYREVLVERIATAVALKINRPSEKVPDISVLVGRWVGVANCDRGRYPTSIILAEPKSAELSAIYKDSRNSTDTEGSFFFDGLTDDGKVRLVFQTHDDRFIVLKNGNSLIAESTDKLVSPEGSDSECQLSLARSG